MVQGVQEDSWLTATGTGIKMQKEGEIDEKKTERSKTDEDILKPIDYNDYGAEETQEDVSKRMRYGGQDLINEAETNFSVDNPNQNRSAAAKRQADRT
ncbi:hypothetical protein Goari_022513 [Gossypium aridum]|uniref:Uncharacterized protein n=1 Tax=Gossypium aridum TaxID=34290 RepID=A0A7J8YVL4_GOSAI|nr:hypothetical protein [Gossypium aridum]